MKRKAPLSRKSRPKARKPLPKVNAKRKASEFVKCFGSRARVAAIKTLPCVVCGKWPSENAHARSRGAGGTWRHVIPLCKEHHTEQHACGTVFYGGMLYTRNDFLEMAEFMAASLPADGGGE